MNSVNLVNIVTDNVNIYLWDAKGEFIVHIAHNPMYKNLMCPKIADVGTCLPFLGALRGPQLQNDIIFL